MNQVSFDLNHFSELPPTRPRADATAGEYVTETFDYDGGRQVTVYVPPDPPEAIIFAGDGQMISQWGALLEPADVPSTMIVGAHRALRDAGADVVMRERAAGHDAAMWRDELPLMVAWAFAPTRSPGSTA
jgi:hypothetical protein